MDAVTPERFAQGMTFAEYADDVGTPENLAREAGWWAGTARVDFSARSRELHASFRPSDAQTAAICWLAAQPGGPANVLAISEEWSSDCRRDVPALARLAEAGGLELRIFVRDGPKVGRAAKADPEESPNADLVNLFLDEKDGETFPSIPVAAFFTRDFRHLYHYIERPAIYHPRRLAPPMQAPKAGETREAAWERFIRDWAALQRTPFYLLWAAGAVNETLSALYERMIARRPG